MEGAIEEPQEEDSFLPTMQLSQESDSPLEPPGNNPANSHPDFGSVRPQAEYSAAITGQLTCRTVNRLISLFSR